MSQVTKRQKTEPVVGSLIVIRASVHWVFRLGNLGFANRGFQKKTKVWKEKIVLERRSLRNRKVNTLIGGKMLAVGKIPETRDLHGNKHWVMFCDDGQWPISCDFVWPLCQQWCPWGYRQSGPWNWSAGGGEQVSGEIISWRTSSVLIDALRDPSIQNTTGFVSLMTLPYNLLLGSGTWQAWRKVFTKRNEGKTTNYFSIFHVLGHTVSCPTEQHLPFSSAFLFLLLYL